MTLKYCAAGGISLVSGS